MTSEIQLPEWIDNDYQNALAARSNPITVERRKLAYDSVVNAGLPNRGQEDWKYTDIMSVVNRQLASAADKPAASTAELDDLLNKIKANFDFSKFAGLLVIVNGFYSEALSSTSWPNQVKVTKFQGTNKETAEQELSDLIASAAIVGQSALSDLNLACLQDGTMITIQKDCALDKPIAILSLITSTFNGKAVYPRLMIKAESGSKAEIIEISEASANSYSFKVAVAEFIVETNANIEHILINNNSDKSVSYMNASAVQAKDSTFTSIIFNLSGILTRNDISVVINGENCNSILCGLSLLNSTQQVDNHTVLDHAQAHCESFELFKGIYADSARGVFDGTIIVRPDAQKTNAIQSNRSLLLSDKAASYAKPQLKIWADDVKCTHGATVGQLDEQALFYLRSRGIGIKEAQSMLMLAFVTEVIDRISNQVTRESVRSIVVERLNALQA